jgi:hypothetical protein
MNNKITIKEATKQISEGFSSIYSKEDVLHLLSVLETSSSEFELTDDQIRDLSADITSELGDRGMDIVDDYELSMSSREVELDSIDFSRSGVQDVVEEIITNFFNSK